MAGYGFALELLKIPSRDYFEGRIDYRMLGPATIDNIILNIAVPSRIIGPCTVEVRGQHENRTSFYARYDFSNATQPLEFSIDALLYLEEGVVSFVVTLYPDFPTQIQNAISGIDPMTINIAYYDVDYEIVSKTRDIIASLVAQNKYVKPVIFGFSETTFQSLMFESNFSFPISIRNDPKVEIVLSLSFMPYFQAEMINATRVQLSPLDRAIVITAPVLATINVYDVPVATVNFEFEIKAEPGMTTTTGEYLEMRFLSAREIARNPIEFSDLGELVPAIYPDEQTAAEEINTKLTSLLSTSSIGPNVPQLFLQSRVLPDLWSTTSGIEFKFEEFIFDSCRVRDVDIGYLFLVFDVRNLELPIPCYCEEDVATLLPEPKVPLLIERLKGRTRVSRRMLPEKPNLSRFPNPSPILSFYPRTQLSVLAMRKEAFNEIIRNLLSLGDSKSTSAELPLLGLGIAFATARWWWKLVPNFESTRITSDGIEIYVSLLGEATAHAGVKDRCGNTIFREGFKAGLVLADSAVRLKLAFSSGNENKLRIEGEFDAGTARIDFDGPGSGIQEDLYEWALTVVTNSILEFITVRFKREISFDIFSHDSNNGYFLFQTPRIDYFPDEAIIFSIRLFGDTRQQGFVQ